MSEEKKRLQEINATIENCVALLVELYNEKTEIKNRMKNGSNIPMQTL